MLYKPSSLCLPITVFFAQLWGGFERIIFHRGLFVFHHLLLSIRLLCPYLVKYEVRVRSKKGKISELFPVDFCVNVPIGHFVYDIVRPIVIGVAVGTGYFTIPQ